MFFPYDFPLGHNTGRVSFLLLLFVLSLLCAETAAQTTTWTGQVSSVWNDAANWSAGVPTNTRPVIIPAGVPNNPSTQNVITAACSSLTVQMGAQLNIISGFPLRCSGTTNSAGLLAGGGVLEFVGAGSSSFSLNGTSNSISIVLNSPGVNFFTAGTFGITGSLTLTAGTLFVGGTMQVQSDLLLVGGVLASNGGILDVDGNVQIFSTSTGAAPTIRCGGSWTSNSPTFSPSSGMVVFDGPNPTVVSGPSPQFFSLQVDAGASVATAVPLQIGGALTINGTFTTSSSLDVNGQTTIAVSGTLAAGSATHTFGSSFTGTGNIVAGGLFVFDGSSTSTISSSLSLPSVRIGKTGSSNVFTSGNNLVNGTFEISSGTLFVGGTLSVNGDTTLSGGTLASNGGTLDLNGSLMASGTNSTNPPMINVTGNWTAVAAGFSPVSNTVTLDGAGLQVISGAPLNFNRVLISTGASTQWTSPVLLNSELVVHGVLTTTATTNILGSLTVNSGGAWNFGANPQSVGASLTINGTISGTAAITLNCASNSTVQSAVSLPSLIIQKSTSPVFTSGNLTISSHLTMVSGSLFVGGLCLVQGNLQGSGGILQSNGGTLDVNGSVDVTSISATSPPAIRVAGQWIGGSGFNPTSNTVTFDGNQQTVSADSNFFSVTVANSSTLTVAGDLMTGGAVTVNGALMQTGTGAPLQIGGALTVAGVLSTTRLLDVNGSFDLNASGQLMLSTGPHSFASSFTASGIINAGGPFVFDSSQNATLNSTTVLPDVVFSKSSSLFTSGNTTISGTMALNSGSLFVGGTLRVTGNTQMNSGNLTNNGGTLDLDGDVIWSGTTAVSPPTVRVSGDWTAHSAFAPTSANVTFDGVQAQSISGASATFFALVVDSSATVISSTDVAVGGSLNVDGSLSLLSAAAVLNVGGALTLNGVLTTSSVLDVNGTFTSNAASVLNAGSGVHTFASTFTANGVLNAAGIFAFDGAFTMVISGSSVLPAIRFQGAPGSTLITSGSLTTSGQVELISGLVLVSGNFSVGGTATFSGGELRGNGGTLDVASHVVWSGTIALTPPVFRCGGNWTAHPAFAPSSGTVVMDGLVQTIGGGTPVFSSLTIESNSSTSSASAIQIDSHLQVSGVLSITGTASPLVVPGNLTISGTLSHSGVLDVGGDTLIQSTASLSAAPGVHTFGRVFSCTGGTFNLPGTLTLDGSLSASFSSTHPVANMVISRATSALVTTAGNITVNGSFTLVNGNLNVGGTLVIQGAANFTGGTLSNGSGVLECRNTCSFSGTTVANPPFIRCLADFSANSDFAPATGTVELSGPLPSVFSSNGSVPIRFAALSIRNSTRTPAGSQNIIAASVTIDNSGELAIAGTQLGLNGGTLSVASSGRLSIGTGGALALSPSTAVNVNSNGLISLIGSPGLPARLIGTNGGGYSLIINGAIAALDFEFRGMGTGGVTLTSSAVISPFPHNLRYGLFDEPSANAGSRLFDIRRNVATEFRNITFMNSNGVGSNNVRVAGGAPILFTNWSGALAGAVFENDPLGLITWGPPNGTELTSFTLTPCPGAVTASWSTVDEVNISMFRVERSLTPQGPWVTVASVPAAGPETYFLRDDSPLPSVLNYYRLSEVSTVGVVTVLALNSAMPQPAILPANVFSVGTPGGFADIQAALDAVVDIHSVVRVASGTYPAFSLNGPIPSGLRIIGDESGPVTIDTSTGPVVITGLLPGTGLELMGLHFGSALTPSSALVINSSSATILITECEFHASGNAPAIQISNSSSVALQNNTISGGPGLRIDSGSSFLLASNQIDELEVLSGSSGQGAGNTISTMFISPGSSLNSHSGLMPQLSVPRTAFCSLPFAVTLAAEPSQFWILAASITLDWFDPAGLGVDMIGLMSPLSGAVVLDASGFTDGAGVDSRIYTAPNVALLYGRSLLFQAVTYDFLSGRYRFSTAASVLFMP